MILDDELREILGRTLCDLLQFRCLDCETLCTWVRVGGQILPVTGCVCNFERVKIRMQKSKEDWESYPPVP